MAAAEGLGNPIREHNRGNLINARTYGVNTKEASMSASVAAHKCPLGKSIYRLAIVLSLAIGGLVFRAQGQTVKSPHADMLFPLCRAAKMCGYMDRTGGIIVPQVYAYTAPFSEGRGRAQAKNGKYLFIDMTGKVAVPPTFDDASDFHDGLARVTVGGRSGFIDHNGAWVIRPSISPGPRALPAGVDDFSDGLAFISELNGRQGWINKNGQLVLNVPTEDNTNWISASGGFSDDLVIFMVSPKQGAGQNSYGYMNKSGVKVIPAQFGNAAPFNHGLAGVEGENTNSGKWGYIDTTGRVVIGFKFSYVGEFSDGLASVNSSNKCGYINESGAFVLQPTYDSCGDFSEGLAYIQKGPQSGFIDHSGKLLFAAKFQTVSKFSGGLAVGQINGEYVYIDQSGKVIIRSRVEIPPF